MRLVVNNRPRTLSRAELHAVAAEARAGRKHQALLNARMPWRIAAAVGIAVLLAAQTTHPGLLGLALLMVGVWLVFGG